MTDKYRYKEIGNKFKEFRKESGLTQEQVAKCLGVDQSYISKIETGERLLTDEALLTKVQNLFLCPVGEFYKSGPTQRYCSISFRSAQISEDTLTHLANLQSIISTQFLMDKIEQEVSPEIVVPEGQNELEFYLNLDDSDLQKLKEEHKKQHPPLPSFKLDELSKNFHLKKIDHSQIHFLAGQLRRHLGFTENEPIDIFQVALEKIPNLTIIFEDLDEDISGICYKGEKSHVIVINQKMSLGRQRFSMARELFHLYYDNSNKKSISSVYNRDDPIETLADAFAQLFLMPSSAFNDYVYNSDIYDNPAADKMKFILQLENEFQISHQAALHRLSPFMDTSDIPKTSIIKHAQQYGFPTELYEKPTHQHKTNGYYFKQLEHLYNARYINAAQTQEFLALSQNFTPTELNSLNNHYDRS